LLGLQRKRMVSLDMSQEHARRPRLCAVILAAGQGKRLLPHTADRPKAMLTVAGKPLLRRTVEHLAAHPFVSEVRVVGGYRFDALEAGLRDIDPGVRAIFNERYQSEGPQRSILSGLAEPWSGGLLILNGDTYIDPELIRSVLDRCEASSADMTLFGSEVDDPAADDVQILLGEDGETLRAVGKNLSGRARLRSAGIFHAADVSDVDRVRRAMEASLEAEEATWHGALNRVIAEGASIRFQGVRHALWAEIDTPHDLERCNARLLASHHYG